LPPHPCRPTLNPTEQEFAALTEKGISMTKRVLRIVGLLSLLLAMAVLGGGVSAAGPGTAKLTSVVTSLEDMGWGHDQKKIKCTFEIDNPSLDKILVSIKWTPTSEPYPYGTGWTDNPIRETKYSAQFDAAAAEEANSITISGFNKTTGNTDFTETVPVPGSWP
jgi:hypothetical protein